MSDIFISYSSKDRRQALSLVEYLRTNGYSCWIDQTGIEGATNWSKSISVAISHCKAFVILLSKSSMASENVVKECSLAAEWKKHILPVMLEPLELTHDFTYHLSGLQRLEIDNVQAICYALEKFTSHPHQTKPHSSRPDLILKHDSQHHMRLAVLPFEDQSAGYDNEWFSDGLTDELIGKLTKLSSLFVTDRQTSREFKNTKLRAKDIATELNVRYIVTGAVRKANKDIRVQATLIDTATGMTLWDEKFNGTMDDIFAIQENTARDIADGLKLQLTPDEEKKIKHKLTENAEAYELYLQGVGFANRNTKEDYQRAIRLYEAAIALDKNFTYVYANLSHMYSEIYRLYEHNPMQIEFAEKAARNAIFLSPSLACGYRALARVHIYKNEFPLALAAVEKAVELEPDDPYNYFRLGLIHQDIGNNQSAAENFIAAINLMPDDLVYRYNLCLQYDRSGEIDKRREAAESSLPYFEKYLLRHPDDETRRINYAILLEYVGRHNDSINEINYLISRPGTDSKTLYNAACIIIRQGEHSRGIDILSQSIKKGFSDLNSFKFDSDLDPVRQIEEFKEILQELESANQ